ncbi:hypothetical protein EOL32_27965, partial [Citrobacter freundii]
DLYKSLYQRTQELSLSGVNADAVLYDPAVPALKPAKPNKSLLYCWRKPTFSSPNTRPVWFWID